MVEQENPFGINNTKRFVSPEGEKELYVKHSIRNHGCVELVDYMGGDEMVERIATAGHGRNIFTEKPSQNLFLSYLATNGILEPFSSVQLKFSIQSPIDTALRVVYEQRASANEYSGRYSVMLDTSFQPKLEDIISKLSGNFKEVEQRARRIEEILKQGRIRVKADYDQLISIDLARELARIGLGTNNDTKYFWKIDLYSLTEFVQKQRALLPTNSITRDFIEQIAEIAKKLAPSSWSALIHRHSDMGGMTITPPNDDIVVDLPLSPPSWDPQITRRINVPNLEGKLFVPVQILGPGMIQAIDYMGDDSSFAQAARTSYGSGTKKLQDDGSLIRTLIRDLHTSPIEMAELAVEGKVPLFVDPRQAGRHRTLDRHGFMGYEPKGSEFYLPPESELKCQDRLNRQGRGEDMEPKEKEIARTLLLSSADIERVNASMIRSLAKNSKEAERLEEYVRSQKGVGFFTKVWRTGDTHNWGHFLRLRLDSHAQKEVRDYAQTVASFYQAHTPIAYQALEDYVINSVSLSVKDQQVMRRLIAEGNFTPQTDFTNLSLYEGEGLIISVDKDDPSKGRKLGREGEGLRKKLERLSRQ